MSQRSYYAWLLGGMLLILGLALASVAKGSTPLPVRSVLSAVAGPLAPALDLPAVAPTLQRIVLDLRLPRVLLAVLVGAGLAMVGGMLQTATRNDLADPFLFGLSSGASAGAVAVITTTGDVLGIWTLPLAALAGGLLAAGVVLALVHKSQGSGPEKLVLAGLAASFLFGALTHYLVFAGDQRAAHSVLFWTLGGLGLARWDNLGLALLGFGLLVAFALHRRHALDGLLAGDETATSLGLSPGRLRAEIFTVSALATACFVALTGVIGFVGLMVPHLARALCGALHGRLLGLSAVLGAALLLASDMVCRTLLAPQELPIGIVTAAVGAVFVIVLVLRSPGH
ncbi:iron complex transport system permease protein [Rhodoferax sp. OV413]|uniref:FecCD family ABC transporter permease n=1 Tax=Rhodoferax sp. OV413 TaxID=1855285 RepID=UPI00088CA40B|nr:iron ABC transporter permease [Rhodoferax sp. OV413]SDP78042.1 iron complex transport system permease protein [Rhodoferax sp. OV413]